MWYCRKGWEAEITRKLLEVIHMFTKSIVVIVSLAYTYVKLHTLIITYYYMSIMPQESC